jgi:hypothetical protein
VKLGGALEMMVVATPSYLELVRQAVAAARLSGFHRSDTSWPILAGNFD